MGTPLRHIVDDIEVVLKQSFDDAQVIKPQLAYWTIIVANNLLAKHIIKRSSGAFLTTFAEVPIQKSDIPGDNLVRDRWYFDLPDCIFDFNNDKGIAYISYSVDPELPGELPPVTQVRFDRTTPAQLRWLYSNEYTKPNAQRPYFYRSKEKVYLLGLECSDAAKVSLEIGLYLTIPPVTEIKLDDPFDFPEELIPILKRQVVDMGRFSLLMPQERINDGNDSTPDQGVPTNKIASVNDITPAEE